MCLKVLTRPYKLALLRTSRKHTVQARLPRGTSPQGKGPLSRRLLLGFLKALLTVGTAACLEVASRPPLSDHAHIPAAQGLVTQAQASFREAQAAAKQGRHGAAVDLYSKVIKMAPREYTLSMRSLLGRHDSLLALGQNEAAGRDARQEFLWGRGIRWPGWYIIAAILIRNEVVD
ncbi:hypothetical protein WJX74_003506 [Apatococcus lobatus]|uniref:Tetratricopeptide repeat protein n=1 Tax=Apatococcus lobatus TaxID=904363 RepID=A0AAW1QZG6_9CHLO